MATKGLEQLEKKPAWDGKTIQGLHIPRAVLEHLGSPQDRVSAVHVGGSNGKGTVCTVVSACLIASDWRVGQFVSPHLQTVTERLLVNGEPVSAERLDRALIRVFEAEREINLSLSYFEAVIVASHLICAEDEFDWQVVEVGLGGRLDATNLMKHPRVTAITSISLEHTHILGDTETAIAREKAGIFRPGVPAVIGPVSPEVVAEIKKAPGEHHLFGREYALSGDEVSSGRWSIPLPAKVKCSYQRENYAVAAYICHLLGVKDEAIVEGMQRARWPGRLEEASWQGRRLLLDGAHNPAGVQGLVDYLQDEKEEITFIISILPTKNYRLMAEILKSRKNSRFLFVSREEATPAEELLRVFGRGEICSSFEEALKRSEAELTVVTGSLYFIGEVREWLGLGVVRSFIR